MPRRDRLRRHPGREPFIEPQIVPPIHGDQVAEPLVRDFVRHDAEHALAVSFVGARPLVEQQVLVEVRDWRPVLHRAETAGAGTPIMSSFGSGYRMPKYSW